MARRIINNSIVDYLETCIDYSTLLGQTLTAISLDKSEWIELINAHAENIKDCAVNLEIADATSPRAKYKGILVFFNGEDANPGGYAYMMQIDDMQREIRNRTTRPETAAMEPAGALNTGRSSNGPTIRRIPIPTQPHVFYQAPPAWNSAVATDSAIGGNF